MFFSRKPGEIYLRSISSQNHLFLEGQNQPVSAPWNQALASADSAGFLGRGWRARQAVPTPMPNSREMTFHEAPAARRVAICSGFTAVRGRPNRFPSRTGEPQSCTHPLLCQRPFELGHRTHDLEHQPAAGRAQVATQRP